VGAGLAPVSSLAEVPRGPTIDYFSDANVLSALRRSGDIKAQRRHVWNVIAYLTQPATKSQDEEPLFETWHGEGELFGGTIANEESRGIRGFSRTNPAMPRGAEEATDVPVVAYTLYNDPAYHHIRNYRLNHIAQLNRLLKVGKRDSTVAGDRSVPPFPAHSIVLKTVWWPVARNQITALPVWDPGHNPPKRSGNSYLTWSRAVAVDAVPTTLGNGFTSITFAGRSFTRARVFPLSAFFHVSVDTVMANRIMRDSESRRAILVALGRPLEPGDSLILVSANLMTREVSDWVWATFWWHDQPTQGPFAADRPTALRAEWRNYLMQVAFDPDKPLAADGGPHIAFNPWLEGRFPDGGHGDGSVSNCMACHHRASYPAVSFLPVIRGAPDLRHDSAYALGRLRTSFLWSLALHAKP
jgi:hypothetical protein